MCGSMMRFVTFGLCVLGLSNPAFADKKDKDKEVKIERAPRERTEHASHSERSERIQEQRAERNEQRNEQREERRTQRRSTPTYSAPSQVERSTQTYENHSEPSRPAMITAHSHPTHTYTPRNAVVLDHPRVSESAIHQGSRKISQTVVGSHVIRTYGSRRQSYTPVRYGRTELLRYDHAGHFGSHFYAAYSQPAKFRATGFQGQTWFRTYGPYFDPYPSYGNASYFVTDAVIASVLSAQYSEAHFDGVVENSVIDAADKEQLRTEVDQAEDDFQQDASLDLDQVFQDPEYLFMVYDSDEGLTASNLEGTETCRLFGGDLIRVVTSPDESSDLAAMEVVTSKPGSCAPTSQVYVNVNELQEMLNQFSSRVDQGLSDAQAQNNIQD